MLSQRILYCSSEIYPLIKTGGLADVAGSLPHALSKAGKDVRLILPAYQSVLSKLKHPPRLLLETGIYDYTVRLSQTTLPGTRIPVWLVECPELYARAGSPYVDEGGEVWPDNAMRFAVYNRMITMIAKDRVGLNWQPHVVHCNDWQTGLVPAMLAMEAKRPATIFTIHNLAYQGIFDRDTFEKLQLPEFFWHYERLEYHGEFSFIKGGLAFADRINTVSPHYAQEILTPEYAYGLEGLLQYRSQRLSGILNGIDTQVWNPGTDKLLLQKYNRQHIHEKLPNKSGLQARFGLPQHSEVLLLAIISRLVEQKGIDLVLSILPELMDQPVQLVVLGSGSKDFESQLQQAVKQWPEKIGIHIGYDEALAHQIEAGADVFLMPSRFEPCGLNQMYSQRYGTLPVVTPVGGLYDTVINVDPVSLHDATATGFVMSDVSDEGLMDAIARAIELYHSQEAWQSVMHTAMQQDFSWQKSAADYSQLYEQAFRDNPNPV